MHDYVFVLTFSNILENDVWMVMVVILEALIQSAHAFHEREIASHPVTQQFSPTQCETLKPNSPKTLKA